MREHRRLVRTTLLLVLLGLATASIGGTATGASKAGGDQKGQNEGPDPAQVQKLKEHARGSVRISTESATKHVSFVEVGQNGDLNPTAGLSTAKAKADDFLNEFGAVLGVESESTLAAVSSTRDALGATHITYQQLYKGVPVFGAELKAHVDHNDHLTVVNGTAVPDLDLSTNPSLSASEAGARAIAAVVADPPTDETGTPAALSPVTLRATAKLVVYRVGLVRGVVGSSQLAYQVEVTNGSSVREFVTVNAHVGKILNRYSAVTDALYRRVFEMSFTPAALVWQEGDPFPDGLTEDQRNIVSFSGDTYRLFFNAFGRDSYDGAGAIMNSVNNDPTISCPNANWNGITTNYCNGVTADDVVAHEWAHAYTQYTDDLIYQWQPGALNESYSDIWGETVDQLNGVGTDSPAPIRTPGVCSKYTVPVPVLIINSPTPGSCAAGAASFGPPLTTTGVTGDLALADDGTAPTSDGCTAFVNAAEMAGKVALIDRGACPFTVKVKNAQDAGAIAAVIANINGGGPFGLAGGDPTITIPSLGISNDNGDLLKSYIAAGTANVTLKVKGGAAAPEDSYKWLEAEDATAFNPTAPPGGHAIRDMWEPTCLSDPGKVSDAEYQCDPSDAGGVHTNSGVPNHGYSLLVDGGMYNGQTVTGLGLTKSAAIYWRAQSVYQTRTTDFADHADALEASCQDLIGKPINNLSTGAPAGVSTQTIAAPDCTSVTAMINAVELRKDPTEQCGFTPLLAQHAPPLCAHSTAKELFSETFEGGHGHGNGLSGWTLSKEKVYPDGAFDTDWVTKSPLPGGREGTAAYAADLDGQCTGGPGDQSGVMRMESTQIKLPGGNVLGPRLSFYHYVATELGFDGGNVKISVNGGAYALIPASAYIFNPPNITLATADEGNTNPLAGEEAFSGTDGGQVTGSWGQSQIDLTKLGIKAGDTIRIRFDFGMDGCGAVDGWYVDDIKVTVCKENKRLARKD